MRSIARTAERDRVIDYSDQTIKHLICVQFHSPVLADHQMSRNRLTLVNTGLTFVKQKQCSGSVFNQPGCARLLLQHPKANN